MKEIFTYEELYDDDGNISKKALDYYRSTYHKNIVEDYKSNNNIRSSKRAGTLEESKLSFEQIIAIINIISLLTSPITIYLFFYYLIEQFHFLGIRYSNARPSSIVLTILVYISIFYLDKVLKTKSFYFFNVVWMSAVTLSGITLSYTGVEWIFFVLTCAPHVLHLIGAAFSKDFSVENL